MDSRHAPSPPSWLVCGMEWPEEVDSDITEAAFAVAPATVPRSVMPPDAARILDYAEDYARERSIRVVFFSDLTRWLSQLGTSWVDERIDWYDALDTIRETPILKVYLAVNRRTYRHLCDTARRHIVTYLDGTTEVLTAGEREEVRAAMLDLLEREWPGYVAAVVAAGNANYADS